MAMLLAILLQYGRNLAFLATILLAGASAGQIVSAHVQLTEANELAEASLARLESEIQRAITQNLTLSQVVAITPGAYPAPHGAPNPAGIREASNALRRAADVWRQHARDGNFADMDDSLADGYRALGVDPPKSDIKYTTIHFTTALGKDWPISEKSVMLAWASLGSALLVSFLGPLSTALSTKGAEEGEKDADDVVHIKASPTLKGAPKTDADRATSGKRFLKRWAEAHFS